MSRTITAYFDSRSDAQTAAERLREAGLQPGEFSIHDETPRTGSDAPAAAEDRGFFGRIADFFLPDEDRASYEEGIRRGGSVLTVRSDTISFERIADIVEAAGAVDLDTREAEWRSQGWTGAGIVPGTAGFGRDEASSRVTDTDTTRSSVGTAGDRSLEANRMTGGTGLGIGSATGAITGREEAVDAQPGRVGAPRSVGGSDIGSRGTLAGGGGQGLTPDPDGVRTGRRETDHGRTRLRSYVQGEMAGDERIDRRDVEVDDRRSALDSEADRLRRGV